MMLQDARRLLGDTWPQFPSGAPELGPHQTLDLHPGGMLYLPRDTFHTVDSSTESLHLSIGFTPLAVREAVLAALDHLSDLDPMVRATVGGRLVFQLLGSGFEKLAPPVVAGASRLLAALNTPGFLSAAPQRRSARARSPRWRPCQQLMGRPGSSWIPSSCRRRTRSAT